jgi:hypothetical protein
VLETDLEQAVNRRLTLPTLPALARPYGILVTDVVTIGDLTGMTAHIERKGVTVLDTAGLAQEAARFPVMCRPRPRCVGAAHIVRTARSNRLRRPQAENKIHFHRRTFR